MSGIVKRTEVDGVPVFWADAGERPFGALLFRVGRADEPVRLGGATHVVEHLAFHGLGERPYPVNGSVDHLTTVLHAGGRADENAAFLADAARALGSLPLDRLAQELRVLRVEAGQRGPSLVNAHFTYRYGTEGPGRAAMTEYGLHGITADEVRQWTREWFTRGNAVAWLSFPPPAGFRLELPDGPRRPPGRRAAIHPLPLPAFGVVTGIGGATLGGPLARTSAGASGTRILRNRAERRLRRDLGLSYEVSLAYLPLDADVAFVSLYASCEDPQAGRVAAELMDLCEAMAAAGPTPEELAEDLDAFRRAMDDPNHALGELARAASSELVGHPQDEPGELEAELAALTPAAVAAEMETLTAGLIAFATGEATLGGRWQPYPMWSADAVVGRRFDHCDKRYPWTKGTPSMIVAPEGVSFVSPAGHALTVRYAACAGVVRASGNRRLVLGTDGFSVRIDPAEWKDGAGLVAEIDRAAAGIDKVTLVP